MVSIAGLERNKAFGEAHPGLYEVVFTLKK
jgi:hypothetical protein